MEMRKYCVGCPGCARTITVEMDRDDERRNADEFFLIACKKCERQWHAKIFERMVAYPFMLMVDQKFQKKSKKGGKKL